MSIYFLSPAVTLFNLIESQTRWINSWNNHFAKSWVDSKINDNHEIVTKKWQKKHFLPCLYFNHVTLKPKASVQYFSLIMTTHRYTSGSIVYIITCHKRDSTLDQSRMAVFEDCQATTLITQPPRLVNDYDNLSFLIEIRSHANIALF